MHPLKPQMDVHLMKPAKLQSSYKKKDELKDMHEDKNCQDTVSYKKQKKCEYNDSKGQSTVKVCSDKNCQEMNVWLPKPAVPYEYRRLCKAYVINMCTAMKTIDMCDENN